jgi:Zn-dependent alcohol dehydrogenase
MKAVRMIEPRRPLPMTLGHGVAGVMKRVGNAVTHLKPGDSLCLHYLVTCGH